MNRRPTYAAKTTVPIEKTRAEIESIVTKYGAQRFAFMNESGRAVIMFDCKDRRIRFTIVLPLVTDKEFKYDGRGRTIFDGPKKLALWEQGCRQKWRALLLCIKAKLESVNAGIEEFEEAFFSAIVDPETNQTVYESARDILRLKYTEHKTGPLLLTGPKSAAGQSGA